MGFRGFGVWGLGGLPSLLCSFRWFANVVFRILYGMPETELQWRLEQSLKIYRFRVNRALGFFSLQALVGFNRVLEAFRVLRLRISGFRGFVFEGLGVLGERV